MRRLLLCVCVSLLALECMAGAMNIPLRAPTKNVLLKQKAMLSRVFCEYAKEESPWQELNEVLKVMQEESGSMERAGTRNVSQDVLQRNVLHVIVKSAIGPRSG
jgi:hypothetical protein